MEAQHTDWRVEEDCGDGSLVVVAEGRDICTVEMHFGDGLKNACLLAAAPKMLEACESVAEWECACVDDAPEAHCPVCLARAAIAAATG